MKSVKRGLPGAAGCDKMCAVMHMEIKVKRFEELTLQELYDILRLRVDVFVVEQHCAYADLDGRDEKALHVFIEDAGALAAYLRVLPRGEYFDDAAMIGRVIAARRGEHLGAAVLRAGIAAARSLPGTERIRIEAQSYAQGFYEKAGFVRCSDEFDEDGIPHVQMVLECRENG